jgi:predicted ribosomally synthesized peptide with SipW-like signal peptide
MAAWPPDGVLKNPKKINGGKKMKSRMLVSLLVIALAAAVIGGATMAWFTDSDETGDVTFTAGTLKINVDDTFDGEPIDVLEFDNMNPGDVYDEIKILIENTGTKKLAWFGDWSVEVGNDGGKLLDAIYIESATMEFLNPNSNPGMWETTDTFISEGKGQYAHFIGLQDTEFGVVTLRNFINNGGMGVDPYEHMGALKPGYAYRLTMQFGFHSDAGNEYQGDVTDPVTLKFKVDATQVTEGALNKIQEGFDRHLGWLELQLGKQAD